MIPAKELYRRAQEFRADYVERAVADATISRERYAGLFDEQQHPRDHGKFATKEGGKGTAQKATQDTPPAAQKAQKAESKSAGMDMLVASVDTLTDDQIKDTYRGVSDGSTREDALVRAALYTAWENRHGEESATATFDSLDGLGGPKPEEPAAPKPFKAQGVAGGQMGLFDAEPSGQKSLFNVVKPAKKGKAKPASRDDLLAGISGKLKAHLKDKETVSQADLSTKFQGESLDGQKSLFRRTGQVERYDLQAGISGKLVERYDMRGQRDLFTGGERRSSKVQGKLKWVTIGGHAEGGKQHVGGNAVQIDGNGTIVGGNVPKEWQGTHISKAGKKDTTPKRGSPVEVATKKLGNRWYSMATLPDGTNVTRSHEDKDEATKRAGKDIDAAGHHVAGDGAPPITAKDVLKNTVDDTTNRAAEDATEIARGIPQIQPQPATAQLPNAPPALVNPLPQSADTRKPRTTGLTAAPAPGSPGLMRVADLKRSPERFQYKLNVDANGVTTQFKDVKFNPELAGSLAVWQDPKSGETFVVNGHHRHELAERSGFDGEMMVYHMDAANEQEARAKGALMNIAGGNGTAVDAAKYFRESGQSPDSLKEDGVSLTAGLTQDAIALAKLSPALFTPLTHGIYRQGRALAIAKHLEDHAAQEELDRIIDQKEDRQPRPVSDHVVEEMGRQMALSARIAAGPQQSKLPGMETTGPKSRSTLAERAEISSAIRRGMTGRLNKFKAVSNSKAAETLGSHNTIDASANRDEANRITGDLDVFDRESVYRGPISDLLNTAAEELANEPSRKNEIIERVAKEVSRYRPGVSGDDSGGDEGGEPGSGERYKPAPGQRDFFR